MRNLALYSTGSLKLPFYIRRNTAIFGVLFSIASRSWCGIESKVLGLLS